MQTVSAEIFPAIVFGLGMQHLVEVFDEAVVGLAILLKQEQIDMLLLLVAGDVQWVVTLFISYDIDRDVVLLLKFRNVYNEDRVWDILHVQCLLVG